MAYIYGFRKDRLFCKEIFLKGLRLKLINVILILVKSNSNNLANNRCQFSNKSSNFKCQTHVEDFYFYFL